MKIAILGGSFDPPHIGHALIATQIKERLPVDEVWLMPAYGHTFDKKLSSPHDRLAMTTFLEQEGIRVSDFEIATQSKGVTIDTLRALKQKYPDHEFSFIIGSDQLADFHKWGKDWQAIFQEFGLIVFPREVALDRLEELTKLGLSLQSISLSIVLLKGKDLILTNVSSSAIRRRARRGLPINLLVLQAVNGYIKKHKLYL